MHRPDVFERLGSDVADRRGDLALLPRGARQSRAVLGLDGADDAGIRAGDQRYTEREGVLYIGKAQEQARVLRTERRYDPAFGHYPWLARLPHPFTTGDRAPGIRYDFSVLQAEFALTQVFDRPDQGRVFFENVKRENLDLGRPDQVQLTFDRRITKRTPSRYLAWTIHE